MAELDKGLNDARKEGFQKAMDFIKTLEDFDEVILANIHEKMQMELNRDF